MATKVVSVRMKPQTLADIYNFLSIACEYNVNNLPISTAVQMSLENMMRWVRQSIELPNYDTDEDALQVVRSFINKIPSAYVETSKRPIFQAPIKEETQRVIGGLSIDQHINKPQINPEGPIGPAAGELKEGDPALLQHKQEVRKEGLLSLIDKFQDKVEEEAKDNLMNAIKSESIYKKEEE